MLVVQGLAGMLVSCAVPAAQQAVVAVHGLAGRSRRELLLLNMLHSVRILCVRS
jgi:hypothetical protein